MTETAAAPRELSRPDFERLRHGCLECGGHHLMPDRKRHGVHVQPFLLCFDCGTEFTVAP